MTTDSPINYPCPSCMGLPGEECWDSDNNDWLAGFHMGRRAARMAALAKASAHTNDRLRDAYRDTHYYPLDRLDGEYNARHRVTTIRRPDPQLPFAESRDSGVTPSQLEAWEAAVKDAVDRIFDSMEAQS